jgi:aspartate/methionine/tyrosine aminotransferase/2-polyprenyl-6-methoxyphenol hydroxylase-like FAD-dependent oxidoreductase
MYYGRTGPPLPVMASVEDMKVRILGGGVAGLAAAVALRRRGCCDVVVFERDTRSEQEARPGHGTMLMPNGVTALRVLGAAGCLSDHRALTLGVFQDERGRVRRSEPMDGTYCVTRGGLIDALRGRLPGEAVEYGRRCTSVALDPPLAPPLRAVQRRVRSADFAAGPSLSALDVDLIVGAEGPRSALWRSLNRGLVRPRSRVFEVVMSSRLPELAVRLDATFVKTVFADRGLAFGLLSPCADHVIGFLQFDVRRHGVPVGSAGCDLVDFAAALLGDVPEPVASFLRDAEQSNAHLWRPVDAEVAAHLCASNAVVIGDAAHPLLPFSSQGVGAALEDAVILGDVIAGVGARRDLLPRAIAGFCDDRRRDVGRFVEGGRRILSHFVGASAGFVTPYVHAAAAPAGSPDEDPLFADAAVDRETLRRRAYNHRWAVQRPGVIPLTAADPDFPVCEAIITAVQRHLGAGYVPYGPAEGLPELRDVATDTLRARHGLRCGPDTLFPTDGAASAMFLVARHVLAVPGDEAIIPDPVDFLLERSVRAAGGVVRRWSTAGGRYDTTQLEGLVTPRTRLISLCNPHNPLGRALRRDELAAIADVALRHNFWILSDEVWSDIVYPPHAHLSMAALDADVAARTFTVFGFSKSYGLAGMRLGLLVAPDPAQKRRLMEVAHAEDTAYGASTISQVAGAAAYELGDDWLRRFVAHLQRRRDQAVTALTAIPDVRCAKPEATFVAFPDVSRLGVDQDELAGRLLERHDVAVVPGSRAFFGPGAAGHLRLSFATSREILAQGLDRIMTGLRSARTEHDLAA